MEDGIVCYVLPELKPNHSLDFMYIGIKVITVDYGKLLLCFRRMNFLSFPNLEYMFILISGLYSSLMITIFNFAEVRREAYNPVVHLSKTNASIKVRGHYLKLQLTDKFLFESAFSLKSCFYLCILYCNPE